MKYLGCSYYPDIWGRERYETDLALMREAGINLVRTGDFAWGKMEPDDGVFALDYLHEFLETAARYEIQVLLATPTAGPPAWLTSAYPEVLLVKADGRRAEHGDRRHYCFTSPTYRHFVRRIADVLSRELSGHKNVIGWQIDNELGPEMGWCHCEHCQAEFQAWLRRQYGSLEALNKAWGNGFWSLGYNDWRQIRLRGRIDPANVYGDPSRKLDSQRFWFDSLLDFMRNQIEVLRANHPGAIITTNGPSGTIFPPVDHYRLFAELDVACDDLYFDIGTQDTSAAAMKAYRCMKPGQPYWVTETGVAALDYNKPPRPEQFKAWLWSNLAHGGEAHLVFRWRTCPSGHEQELQGILEHSGAPRARYQTVKRVFNEMAALREELAGLPLPEAQVAIIQDYQTMWAYEASRVFAEADYLGLVHRMHKALYDRNIMSDIIPPGRDLAAYKLVILPTLVIITPQFAEQLKAYVAGGGRVLAMGQIGMRDWNNNYLTHAGPDHLQELLGCTIEGGMYLRSQMEADECFWTPKPFSRVISVGVAGALGGRSASGQAEWWIGDIELQGGEALMRFTTEDCYAGQPAVVANKRGPGQTLYVAATKLDAELKGRIVAYALERAGVAAGSASPEFVEVVRRGDVVFAVNHTPKPCAIDLGPVSRVLLGEVIDGAARLGAYGVCVARA